VRVGGTHGRHHAYRGHLRRLLRGVSARRRRRRRRHGQHGARQDALVTRRLGWPAPSMVGRCQRWGWSGVFVGSQSARKGVPVWKRSAGGGWCGRPGGTTVGDEQWRRLCCALEAVRAALQRAGLGGSRQRSGRARRRRRLANPDQSLQWTLGLHSPRLGRRGSWCREGLHCCPCRAAGLLLPWRVPHLPPKLAVGTNRTVHACGALVSSASSERAPTHPTYLRAVPL
jgi:hypothetical protein